MINNKLNILLLEDEKYQAQLIIKALNKAKYNVFWTINNSQAIKLLKSSEKIDAIIFDFRLRGEDSVELCLMLKNDPSLKKYKNIYTILCTNYKMSDFENMINYPKIKYDDYIFKGNSAFTKEIVKKLNEKFSIKETEYELKTLELEDETEFESYIYFPAIESKLIDLDIEINDDGISSLKIEFSNPDKLPLIKMYIDYFCIANLEILRTELTQEQKANILGVHRNTYIRMLSGFNTPDNKEIRENIFKFIKIRNDI